MTSSLVTLLYTVCFLLRSSVGVLSFSPAGYTVSHAHVNCELRFMLSQDFGVWNVSYASVSCTSNWAGASDQSALGSVADLGSSGCCPADPTVCELSIYNDSGSKLVRAGKCQ